MRLAHGCNKSSLGGHAPVTGFSGCMTGGGVVDMIRRTMD